MNRQRILQIARWEYVQKARLKSFIITILVLPLMIGLMAIVPGMIIRQTPDTTETIGLIDRTDSLGDAVGAELPGIVTLESGEAAYTSLDYMRPGEPVDSALARARADAKDEVIEGVVVIEGEANDPTVTYRSFNPNDIRVLQAVQEAIDNVVTHRRLRQAGIDTAAYERVSEPVTVTPQQLTDDGETEADFMATFWKGYAGIILFMILILSTGQALVRGLVEEKSNRIVEILVSSATPDELMWGKLIGLSGLGLTQVVAWIGLFLVMGVLLPGALDTSPILNADLLTTIPFLVLYIALGYLFYAAIFIGVGALVTSEQEAQMVTQYLTFFLAAPIALSFGVIMDPTASWVQVLSFIPFFTPPMMMIQVVSATPPLWMILATVAIMLLSTAIVTWLAGRIFRTAILLYGKRPSVREVLRWVAASSSRG